MASYKQAIAWMVDNDDTEWATNGDPGSVTAAIVADLFNKTDEQVRADVQRALGKAGRPSRTAGEMLAGLCKALEGSSQGRLLTGPPSTL